MRATHKLTSFHRKCTRTATPLTDADRKEADESALVRRRRRRRCVHVALNSLSAAAYTLRSHTSLPRLISCSLSLSPSRANPPDRGADGPCQ
jgi:hypothetical protein